MQRIHLACVLACAVLTTACGSVASNIDAPPPPDDGGVVDALDAGPPIDGPDAMPIDAPPPPPGQDFTGGAGRISGPTFSMDVQVGHPISQQQIQSGTFRLEANTPIKP